MTTAYRLRGTTTHLGTSNIAAGTVVYGTAYHDYGIASSDSRFFFEEYRSVSLTPDGDYPYYTVPVRLLGPATETE